MDEDRDGHRYGSGDGKARRVLHDLRSDIVTGALPQGERLTESSLCERYQVSRVPVREALRTLAGQGFVVIRPNQGANVAVVDEAEADDLFAVRTTIEELTAARCARRVADGERDVVAELWQIVAEGETELAASHVAQLAELNTRFHLTLAENSGSSSLAALLRQVAGRMEWIYTMSMTMQARRSWAEHRDITTAIEAGDAPIAARLVREHVARAHEVFHAHRSARTTRR